MIPLSLARRACVHGRGAPPAAIPLSGAATWHPVHGLAIHDALDVAALYVVRANAARSVSSERVGPIAMARILAVGAGIGGLTCAAERALLAEARAACGVQP